MSRSLTTNVSNERGREFNAYDLVALSSESAIPANDSFLSLNAISSNSIDAEGLENFDIATLSMLGNKANNKRVIE